MTCPKCGGLVVTEHGARRCVNCGLDPDLILRKPDESEFEGPPTCRCGKPLWPGRKQCRACLDACIDKTVFARKIQKGVTTMSRFKTEEGKQRWLAAMAKRRGEKRKGGGSTTAVAVSAPAAITVRPRVVAGGGVREALDHLLQENDQDRAALERVKEMLERR
jgi:hypothetical protein